MAWIRACGGGSPAVPDGKTVTPINDVTIWQQCAGIANPTYTTLAEILADSGVLSALMASDNAVDYMVRSKGFSGSKSVAVPTMTSNTTPSGEAFASSEYNIGSAAWKAFDKLDTTHWSTADYQQNNATIGYRFTKDVVVNSFTITTLYDSHSIIDYTVDVVGIKSDNTEETIASGIAIHNPADKTVITKTFANTNQYRGYCLRFPNGNSTAWANLNELQFAFVGVCDNANAMTYIGQNNYASNTLLADSDWCEAICNSTYYEDVLNAKVPVMTSDTTPSGVCSASSVQSSNYTAYKAFDSAFTGVGWLPLTADGWGNAWVAYMFTTDVKVKRIKLYFYDVYNDGWVTTIKIQGKNTETNLWDDISSNIAFNENTTKVQNINTANSNKKYQQFRLLLVSGSSGMTLGVGNGYNVQFYGREDV